MLLVEITLHRFGALQAQPLVVLRVADVVGVAFDLDPHTFFLSFFSWPTIVSMADLASSGSSVVPNLNLP